MLSFGNANYGASRRLDQYHVASLHFSVGLLVVALTNNALPFTCFAWGERVIPSNTAALINGPTPIWSLLLSLAATRTRASLNTILGVIVGLSGVALVVTSYNAGEAGARGGNAMWGILVIALGALGYAIATVIAKTKLRGLDPIGLATTQLSLAALMLTPIAVVGKHPAQIHLESVLAVLVLGLAGSGVAYLLYYSLLARISATQVTAVTYLLPLWGMFWGVIAHESIRLVAYIGAAVVVAGLILMNCPVAHKFIAVQEGPAEICVD
jgi:drug/metabolite transporter (DMT)-like permease